MNSLESCHQTWGFCRQQCSAAVCTAFLHKWQQAGRWMYPGNSGHTGFSWTLLLGPSVVSIDSRPVLVQTSWCDRTFPLNTGWNSLQVSRLVQDFHDCALRTTVLSESDPDLSVRLTKHTSRCPCHHVLSVVQLADVLAHVGPSNAGVTLDVHVVSQSQQHLDTQERQNQSETSTNHSCSQMTGWVWWCGRGYLLNLSSQLSGWSEDQSLGLPHLQTGDTSQHDDITSTPAQVNLQTGSDFVIQV